MEFSIKTGSPEKQRSECLVIGIFSSSKTSLSAQRIDRASGGYIKNILARGDMDGKLGNTLLLYDVPKLASKRVLLVGLGAEGEYGQKSFRSAVRASTKALMQTGVTESIFLLTDDPVKCSDIEWKVAHAAVVIKEAHYRFDRLKSNKQKKAGALQKIGFSIATLRDAKKAEGALRQGIAIARGMELAKDLGNLPSNICTPSYLAQQAGALAKTHKLKVEILERKDMQRLGMGSLLAVTQGSQEPPKLISLSYQGGGKQQKPVVLVGKGITFDTGGISLKPAGEMDEMKFDMCGAASVLGTVQAVAEMGLAINLIGIVPTCENMPSGTAIKPGDVVTSMSGQTIEILNTDAEGRLILCDALTFAEKYHPQIVIDIATLTGACVIALGNVATGLFSNNEELANELLAAGDKACDRAWRLPLWEDYQEQLSSNFADMANIGGRPGGSITAACFLSRFTKKFHWAHLDIAGTAWKSGKEKGATGRPVPLLTQYLIHMAATNR